MPLRLKSLELQGYKTFANATLFEFADKVTAIVGPNGSGKSNIADSIRWVLGEQSYTLLRGRKTEDMIFSGSESRPRSGMASATITFDNSDNWLPIDFSEVAIARRAFRDGQNEYLINGQRVRLRDVSELLAQSGLAERTYTVIGQGLVDAALSLKADERRRLFEEAAGIGLYRSRREDAIRRLEMTNRNLERVQDILAELKPRLRSLERQARRAKEFAQVETDLHVLLREWYGYHWHRAQRELAQAQAAARLQDKNLEKAKQQQSILDISLVTLRGRVQKLRTNLGDWRRELAQLHTQHEALSRSLAVAEERKRSLIDQQQNIEFEYINRREEQSLYEQRLADLESESSKYQIELEEAKNRVVEAQQDLLNRQAARSEIEENLNVLAQQLSSLNTRQGQLDARRSERISQANRIQDSLETVAQALRAIEKEHEAAEKNLEKAQSQLRNAESKQQTAEKDLTDQRRRAQDYKDNLGALLEKRTIIATTIARSTAQLAVIEQAEISMAGYGKGAQALLQAAKHDDLMDATGALSHFLEVPVEFEPAIVAVLGEYLDAVLLDAGLDYALDLLLQEAVRGVLLPIPAIEHLPRQISEISGEEILGVAADLVRAPDELRSVVELLLGNVVIVRDRKTAKKIIAGQPMNVRVATLNGEVFNANGTVQALGMADSSGGDQTVLSRMRQKRELEAELKNSQNDLEKLGLEIREVEIEITKTQDEVLSSEKAYENASQAFQKAVAAETNSRSAFDRIKRQYRWQSEQQSRLQAELIQNQEDEKGLAEELSVLGDQIREKREKIRQQNAQLATLSLDEFQSQFAHWKTLVAVAERALGDINTRKSEQEASISRLRNLQAKLELRLEEIKAEQSKEAEDQKAKREELISVAELIESSQLKIEPAEIELVEAESQQDLEQQSEADARHKLNQAEHFNAQARISLARKQEALQTWQRRIEDDLGLVAFEYVDQISGPTPLPLSGLVEQLPVIKQLSPDLEETIKRMRAQLRRMGAINPEAQQEYREVQERFEYMMGQVNDLREAEIDVRQVIDELDALMQREFRKTFEAVAGEFKQIFTRLFGGGSARLVLTDPNDLTTSGVDIEARLPGRRTQGLSLLSGGERSLTATALVFALIKVSPTPFCVLDEVDAMLDEANVGRFRELLGELSTNTQFVIVTHNRNTVQVADVIYGITMGRDSASQILSLKLDEVSRIVD